MVAMAVGMITLVGSIELDHMHRGEFWREEWQDEGGLGKWKREGGLGPNGKRVTTGISKWLY